MFALLLKKYELIKAVYKNHFAFHFSLFYIYSHLSLQVVLIVVIVVEKDVIVECAISRCLQILPQIQPLFGDISSSISRKATISSSITEICNFKHLKTA